MSLYEDSTMAVVTRKFRSLAPGTRPPRQRESNGRRHAAKIFPADAAPAETASIILDLGVRYDV